VVSLATAIESKNFMSTVDSALFLVEMGFKVFPISENTKFPLKGSNGFKDATDNAELVRMWWQYGKNHNIGVATGKYGENEALIVVDVDCKNGGPGFASLEKLESEGRNFPRTLRQLTPSGGMHLIYKWHEAVFQGRAGLLAPGIDIRSRGGYILMCDSRINGKDYEFDILASIETAPEWLVDFLHQAESAAKPKKGKGIVSLVSDVNQTDAMADAVSYLLELPAAQMGQLDELAFRASCWLRDLGCSQTTALDAMKRFWKYDGVLESGHIETVVGNAFYYAKNDQGASAPGLMFEQVAELNKTSGEGSNSLPDPEEKRKLFLEWNDACVPFIGKPALIEDLLPVGGSSLLWGKPNTGKTFLALDMAFKVALGLPWFGRDVEQGFALYIAAEAGQSIKNRIHAFNQKFGVVGKRIPFAVVPCQIDLFRPNADIKPLIQIIKAAEMRPSLIILDTLARIMSGGNENEAADMGRLIDHAGALTTLFGSHVMFVHHANKTGDVRGSTALQGGIDTEIEITDKHTIKIGKNREFARDERPVSFSLQVVEIGVSPKGKVVTSCVVDEAPTIEGFDGISTKEGLQALSILPEVFIESGMVTPQSWGVGQKSDFVLISEWRDAYMYKFAADKNKEQQVYMWRKAMENADRLPHPYRLIKEQKCIIKA
jgi:hypothetical protein